MKHIFSISLFFIFALITLQAQTKAFPTAEGFGCKATGGRGGVVIEVTNLADDATGATEGSLRWALNQSKTVPATIVFRVGGIIKLVADLRSTRTAGTTIAGQTAPGDGITIRGAKTNLGGSSNLIIRNIRFRIGLKFDSVFIAGGSIGIENASNLMIDRCTFGWSGEENMTMYDLNLITVQWCLIHEGLYSCGHPKGARGYGCQWGGQTATFHHNLLANNYTRTPRFNGARSNDINVLIDYVNNVNFNWGKENGCYGSDLVAGVTNKTNMVNNYYKPGPARQGTSSSWFTEASFNSTDGQTINQIPVFYMNGNIMEGSANSAKNTDNTLGLNTNAYTGLGISRSSLISATPFTVTNPVATQTAAAAYISVLAKVGLVNRDSTERRIVNEVRTGTVTGKGSFSNGAVMGIIDNPSRAFGTKIAYPDTVFTNAVVDADHDGMSDVWEVANGLNPADAADRNTLTPSGYTALEVYLNSLMGETIPFGTVLKKNAQAQEVGFYPNPVNDRIHLISAQSINRYSVCDLTGKCLQQGIESGLTNINVNSLKSGMYLLALETESGSKVNLKFTK